MLSSRDLCITDRPLWTSSFETKGAIFDTAVVASQKAEQGVQRTIQANRFHCYACRNMFHDRLQWIF